MALEIEARRRTVSVLLLLILQEGRSYFGDYSIMNGFDVELIPEFDGPSIVEWFEKAECVFRLSKIKAPAEVIPLRLTGGAFNSRVKRT